MTVNTVTQARDEIHAAFDTPWKANVNSQNVPVQYDDVAQDPPKGTILWARFNMKHNEGRQATLAGADGTRRYSHTGAVTVQIFTERGDGQRKADMLAKIAKDAFQGTATRPGGIIFKRVRINEVRGSGVWYQTNVLADFEYDEVS